MPNEIDDRINVRIGEELKRTLDGLVAADPGKPTMAVIVRRLLSLGLKHQEQCEQEEKNDSRIHSRSAAR